MNSSNESNNKPSSIPSGDNDTYYLKGPSEFAAPVEKEDTELKRLLSEFAAVNYNEISKTKTTKGAIRKQNKNVDRYTKLINGWLQEENARLRSLIDIAFDTGRKGPYPTKEQFKKDNNL
jgi:hypothetical protein